MPTHLSYGVEAEFLGIRRSVAVTALNDNGVPAQDDGYHHDRRSYWRVTEDGSVNGEGNELVSPVLGRTTTNHTSQLKAATKALREAGAVVDVSCGLHVHHSLSRKDVEDVAQACGYYTVLQPIIDTILPGSRKGRSATSYAQPMGSFGSWERWLARVREVRRVTSEDFYNFGRYHSVNLNSAPTHGTLEFRQHSGTLNATKVLNWTKFTRLFMDLQQNGVMPVEEFVRTGKAEEVTTIEDAIKHLAGDIDGRKLRPLVDYYNDRARTFGQTDNDDEDVSEGGTDFGHTEREEDEDDYEGNWCESCGEYHNE